MLCTNTDATRGSGVPRSAPADWNNQGHALRAAKPHVPITREPIMRMLQQTRKRSILSAFYLFKIDIVHRLEQFTVKAGWRHGETEAIKRGSRACRLVFVGPNDGRGLPKKSCNSMTEQIPSIGPMKASDPLVQLCISSISWRITTRYNSSSLHVPQPIP